MRDANVIEGIRDKHRDLSSELDDRGRRMWAAVEARSLGRGGIVAVSSATGISDRTIRNGIRDLASGDVLSSDGQRRSGGGRKTIFFRIHCLRMARPRQNLFGQLIPLQPWKALPPVQGGGWSLRPVCSEAGASEQGNFACISFTVALFQLEC